MRCNRSPAVWAAGGSLDIELIAKSEERLNFNVTRCRYAEFSKELGLAELGYLFHCNRDFAMVKGFSPSLSLARTQTISVCAQGRAALAAGINLTALRAAQVPEC